MTLQEIEAARSRLPPIVRRTPVVPCAVELTDVGQELLFLKLENLQVLGAYKIRAAFTVVDTLTPEERARGIVMMSSGNFAQAFALAGKHFGIRTMVVMLKSTSAYKVSATRQLGAEVDLFDGQPIDRQLRVEELGREHGLTIINTWENRAIIAGHATLGLEIIADLPSVEQVLVPVSSGGIAAGVSTAVKLVAPHIRVVGVQPAGACAAYLSLKAGHPVSVDNWNTIADGLSARRPGDYPFSLLQQYLDEMVLIEERDIAVAHIALRRRAKVVAEPAGAVATAAYLAGQVNRDLRTVAIVTGGNLTDETMHAMEALANPV